MLKSVWTEYFEAGCKQVCDSLIHSLTTLTCEATRQPESQNTSANYKFQGREKGLGGYQRHRIIIDIQA